jgi:hypothetical protein
MLYVTFVLLGHSQSYHAQNISHIVMLMCVGQLSLSSHAKDAPGGFGHIPKDVYVIGTELQCLVAQKMTPIFCAML